MVNGIHGRPPQVSDYVYICDKAYTPHQILEMEKLILTTLDFRLSLPTVWSWMPIFAKSAGKRCEKHPMFFNLVAYIVNLRSLWEGCTCAPPCIPHR